MNIIEQMLSKVKQNQLFSIIKEYTDEYIPDSFNMSEHLKAWALNKQHIYELFGNKLTIEKEIETTLGSTVVSKKLREELFTNEFAAEQYTMIRIFLNHISPSEITSNILEENITIFDTTFKKGIKVTKCFRSLIKKQYLDEANIKYSMFLQSLKTKGRAVISIDPIDYLTMSANNSGWCSCHHPDGDWRTGTVSYMMDPSTVITYIKSSEDCYLEDGTVHSNKIWRQIALINPTNYYAMQARQYPNTNALNCAAIGDMLLDLLQEKQGTKYIRNSSHVCEQSFKDLQRSHGGDRLYYNDIEHESFDEGFYIIPEVEDLISICSKIQTREIASIVVGYDVPCLCGCCRDLKEGNHYFYENESDYED